MKSLKTALALGMLASLSLTGCSSDHHKSAAQQKELASQKANAQDEQGTPKGTKTNAKVAGKTFKIPAGYSVLSSVASSAILGNDKNSVIQVISTGAKSKNFSASCNEMKKTRQSMYPKGKVTLTTSQTQGAQTCTVVSMGQRMVASPGAHGKITSAKTDVVDRSEFIQKGNTTMDISSFVPGSKDSHAGAHNVDSIAQELIKQL